MSESNYLKVGDVIQNLHSAVNARYGREHMVLRL